MLNSFSLYDNIFYTSNIPDVNKRMLYNRLTGKTENTAVINGYLNCFMKDLYTDIENNIIVNIK